MAKRGLDISHYQGMIDWNILKAVNDPPIDFVIIKAGEGVSWVDPMFKRNVAEARRVGIPWGAYFYWYPQYDPIAQAENFLNILMGYQPEFGIWGDFEQKFTLSANQTKEWAGSRAVTFMNAIDDVYKAGVYTAYYYFKDYLGNPPAMIKWGDWIATYFNTQPMIPAPWTKAVIWQDGSNASGTKFGAESMTIDTNTWMGTDEEFEDFLAPSGDIPVDVVPPLADGALFLAKCIQAVDTRNEFDIDIKMDLHVGDYVNVYEVNANGTRWRIDPVIQRWVVSSPNYMFKIEPVIEQPVLFRAICIKPEGVDTRNEFGVDIKQDLKNEQIVSVYEEKGNMYRIEPTVQRWVTQSTNYMLPLRPPAPYVQKDIFSIEEKAVLKKIRDSHPELNLGG